MRDLADKFTEEQIKDLDRRIHSVYSEAARDIQEKLDEFNRKFKTKNDIKFQEWEDGKITKEDYDNWVRGQIFQSGQWETKRDQITQVMINSNQVAANIVNGQTTNVFAMNATYMNYMLEHGAGVNFGFGIYDKSTVENLITENPQLLPQWKINEQKDYVWNKKQVNNAVTQGIIQGEKLDQITDRIASGLALRNENLAKTFARTAMTGAQNAGRLESLSNAEQMGINVYKQWMATLDGHTRDSHQEIDGESVPINQPFSNGLMYPADPSGDPAEVYNCRCTMVGDLKKYSAEYKRYDNINGTPIRDMSYSEWKEIKSTEKSTGVHINLPTSTEFKRDFDVAKSTLPKGGEWRVDDTYTAEDYKHKKLFELDGKSCVAVTYGGDIVSVCKNLNGNDRGSDLLKVAVANGGDRLDAFGDGLYKFYTKNGFEPVSWTPFNEEYAPHDWVKGRDNPEPVVFYRYTGKITDMSYADFLGSTPAYAEYDDAMVARNKLIDSFK